MCLLCITNRLPQTTYCERGESSALLAESINAFTNLAFPLAGFLGYKLLKEKKIKDKELIILPWLLAIIGLGSFIYHTARNSITVIFDGLPIYIFILYALFLMLKELFRSKLKAIAVLIGFITLEIFLSLYIPRDFLNGSIRHTVAIAFISLIGLFAFREHGHKILKPFISVITLYALAIIFRSVDMFICQYIPIGTHFLWHILSAFAGYQAIALLSVLKSESYKLS